MNNFQKKLLLEGLDFPISIDLDYLQIYFNDLKYFIYFPEYPNHSLEVRDINTLYFSCLNLKSLNKFRGLSNRNVECINLSINEIDCISFLVDVDFPNLKKLYLHTNQIKDAIPLLQCNFPKLEILTLYYNPINPIDLQLQEKFPQCKTLWTK